jgi:aldose 1-epimerase
MSSDIVILRDDAAGTSAKILAGLGFNCFSFEAVHGGRPVEVIWSAPAFASGTERPSGSGIPILFPFPGRMRGTRFELAGRTFELPAGDRFGNAIHGIVYTRPWAIVERTATRAVGQFHASRHDPALLDCWPADFCLTATYELAGNTLRCDLLIENPDDHALPWGLGVHPYFRLPLSAEKDQEKRRTLAEKCRITVPAAKHWELIDMLPTGRCLNATGARAVSDGMDFARTQLDDVFTDLEFCGGQCTATIEDPASNAALAIRFQQPFANCVVYNPPHREAICIEPYSCVPGQFGEQGGVPVQKALSLLPPGGSVRTSVTIELQRWHHAPRL